MGFVVRLYGFIVVVDAILPKTKKIALFTSSGVDDWDPYIYLDGYVLWQIGRTSCNLEFFCFIHCTR